MKKILLCLLLLSPTANADLLEGFSDPEWYFELKIVHNIQPWTDWMIKDDRECCLS